MLLNSHSKVICYGELFNPSKETRQNAIRSSVAIKPNEDPKKYLKSNVFKRYSKDIEGVGFRLFYTHARKNDNWTGLWPYIATSDIKIIHLKRKDLLAQFLSLKQALRSNVWVSNDEKNKREDGDIWLDPEECSRYFINMRWCELRAKKEFANSSMLEISYEELAQDQVNESQKILSFLELPYENLSSKTKKQRKKPKSKVIKNYAELRDIFSTWPTYFDD